MYYRLFAMFAHCFPGLCGIAVRFSYTNLIAQEVHDAYNIVFLKFAFDVGDSDRKNAGCLLRAEDIRGTFVNMNFPFGESFAVGNPFLYTGYRFGGRDKARANRIVRLLQQVYENIIPFSVGDDDRNPFVGYLAGDIRLRQHTATTEARFGSLDIVG